ncbi:Uncharacterized membrane protein [Caldanaerovirga acetigignens]|uniref:Uncharacterized membrane protein n=1 Tax=Caldanaerovirga acetigignens TaxID=447595 RepID=A0A1M7HLB7_9FIRM|nr:heparan-alpha-glucosaminide N-acetyltransferase [Caldanaerovirga acetigignens]SHM29296.1 Uncharacterized membrane protein [Caldanaerovirga acetigignens]
MKHRIVELDSFRGIAVFLMVIFHGIFDLSYYFGLNIDYSRGFWYYEGKLSALMFIWIAGISSYFSRNPRQRGIKLFLFSMAITVATYLLDSTNYIRFGILHFLGTSYMLSPCFKKIDSFALVLLALAVLAAGTYFDSLTTQNPYLFPLGITTPYFSSLDYYPLIPYFGVFLLGMAFGRDFYAKGYRIFGEFRENFLSLLGRHSLIIYLIHQPVLLLFLFIARKSGIL